MKKRCLVAPLLLCCAAAVCRPAAAETPRDPVVSIVFAGDILLDGKPGRAIKRGADPFAHVPALLDAVDIRVGNLECVISDRGRAEPGKPYTFRAHPRSLNVLKRHFDAVTLANNHSGDFGTDAFGQMLDFLDQQKIGYFGGGVDLASAHKPLLIERNGLRIALLGYNEFFPRSYEADFDQPGVAWSEDEQVRLDITNARKQFGADLVIPVMHWGWEFVPIAGLRQRQLARLMIDAGADAVVGSHPHVTQDIEIYDGKPIIYSLGNFVFDGFTGKIENTGWLLRMELDRQGATRWRTYIVRIDGQGIPHQDSHGAGQCWVRGQGTPAACSADGAL